MKRTVLGYAFAAGLVLGAPNAFAASSQPRTDEAIAGRIEDAVFYNPYVSSDNLRITVFEGKATISGSVGSAIEKELVEKIAYAMSGVKSVDNNLAVDEKLHSKERSEFVQKVRDLTTTSVVRSKLLANRLTAKEQISVETKKDDVILSGEVSSGAAKERAEDLALSSVNVADVTNNLTIKNPKGIGEKMENAAEDVAEEVSDLWVGTKVRSSLNLTTSFPGSKVDVATSEGIVTLTGTVRSEAQRTQIEDTVKEIVGVRSVKNLLTVRPRAT